MNYDSMPKELVELENRLGGRTAAEPTDGLRDRIMRSVAGELAFPGRVSTAGQANGWGWAAVAAAVMIMNLSLICASRTEFSIWPTPGHNQMASELHALRALEAQEEGTFK